MTKATLTSAQRRAVKRLERAIAACKSVGIAVVADFDNGFRVMPWTDLSADDLREKGFTIESHGGCGCPVLPRFTTTGG